jgi:superfamily II DNA or RNA helicase
MISKRKVNTLVLVHTSALLSQWKKSLSQFLTIDEPLPEQPKGRGRKKEVSAIGQLGGTKNTLNGKIDIAIAVACKGERGERTRQGLRNGDCRRMSSCVGGEL